MVTMEKVTYKPLIEVLKKHNELYNGLYKQCEMTYGPIPSELITKWVVNSIEPIVKNMHERFPESNNIHPVFEILYTRILKLLANKSAISYENEYKKAWAILEKAPHLLTHNPGLPIRALDAALLKIRAYAPKETIRWIMRMTRAVPNLQSTDEFLKAGRIFAWFSGLAHLKENALTDFKSLSQPTKELILSTAGFDGFTIDKLEQTWHNKENYFHETAGGFKGFNGPFRKPPKVTLIDDKIFATDSNNHFAFFVDRFGHSFLPAPKFEVNLSSQALKNAIALFSKKSRTSLPESNISSMVIANQTAVFTLDNSHLLYIFSHPDS